MSIISEEFDVFRSIDSFLLFYSLHIDFTLVVIDSSLWGPVCVVIDKLDKLPRDTLVLELEKIGISKATANRLIEILQVLLYCFEI